MAVAKVRFQNFVATFVDPRFDKGSDKVFTLAYLATTISRFLNLSRLKVKCLGGDVDDIKRFEIERRRLLATEHTL